MSYSKSSRSRSRSYYDKKDSYRNNKKKHREPSYEQKREHKIKKVVELERARELNQSDFRSHITFENLPIQKDYEEQFLISLKDFISSSVGKVEIIQKVDKGREREKEGLTISLAFRDDKSALDFIDSPMTLEMKFKQHKISLKPQPSKSFYFYMDEAKRIIKQEQRQAEERKRNEEQRRREKERFTKNQHKKHSSRGNRSSRSHGKEKRSKDRKNDRKRNHSSSDDHHSPRRNRENQVQLKLFGLTKNLKEKDILPVLKNHREGPFFLQTWSFEFIDKAQYFQISLPEKAAYSLMNLRVPLEIQGCTPLILKCGKDSESIRNALSEHQVRIDFNQYVHPLNVYGGVKEFGKIIQMVTQNSQNKTYYITMLESKSAKTLANLKLDGIQVTLLREGQLVYRPTQKHSLKSLMQKRKSE